jgi:hypothetical protein
MPGRTNAFQQLVKLLVTILREGDSFKVTESAMVPSRIVKERREIDVCVEGERDGAPFLIGIECRAWKRAQSVGFVEEMYGKHSHLPTSELVLVSSSGFTPQALKLAEHYGIKAITPGEVTPGFVGRIVNNLDRVWVKKVDYAPTGTRFWGELPGGERIPVDLDYNSELYFSDESTAPTALEFARRVLQNLGSNHPAIRDAVTGETDFKVTTGSVLVNEKALCVKLVETSSGATILAPVVDALIVGRAAVEVVELPLTHGSYDGTDYSTGQAPLGGQMVRWAIVERGAAPEVESMVTKLN